VLETLGVDRRRGPRAQVTARRCRGRSPGLGGLTAPDRFRQSGVSSQEVPLRHIRRPVLAAPAALEEANVSRLSRALLLAMVALGLAAPSAAAVPQRDLGGVLGNLWDRVLETPTAENPFAGGDPCVDLGPIVAPLGPSIPSITCTVKPATKLFITGWSSECSTFEAPPFFGRDEAELRACARAADAGLSVPTITVDETPVPVSQVETGLLRIHLPKDNVFGTSDRKGLSVAHGWVSFLGRLSPGTHEIVIHLLGTYLGDPVDLTNTTTIIVTRQ
jgi:hypothetical protein